MQVQWMLHVQSLPLGFSDTIVSAEDDFRADRASSHAGGAVLAGRAALAEVVPEILKNRPVPRLLNGVGMAAPATPMFMEALNRWAILSDGLKSVQNNPSSRQLLPRFAFFH